MTLREIALQLVLLAVLLGFVYPATYLRGEVIAPGDILFEMPPWKAYSQQETPEGSARLILDAITAMDTYYAVAERNLNAGEWPLWNQFEYAGMPLMANFQSCVFYPPRLLHCFLELFTATTFFILLKLILCGLTAYVCGRMIGLRVGPSRFLSVAWMLAGYNLLWSYWPLPDVAAWLPIVFLGAELALMGKYRQGFFAEAIGGALILLAGHPETALVMSMGVGLYFLLRLIWERRWGRDLWMPIAAAGGGWVLALLVCAVQILPFLEYLLHSYSYADRAAREASQKACLEPSAVVGLWVPRFFGTWVEDNFWGKWNSNLTGMTYTGVAVWVGVVSLAAKSGRTRPERARIGALLISGLVFLLSTYNAPPMQWVHYMPVLNTMVECYHAAWPVFVLPLLAALGFNDFFSKPRRLRELWPFIPVLVAVIAIVWFVYSFNNGLIRALGITGYVKTQMVIAAAFAAASLMVLFNHCFFNRRRLLMPVLTVLVAADLLLAVHGQLAASPRDELFFETKTTNFLLEKDKPCRVGVGTSVIPGGIMPIYGIEQWLAYDGIYPERMMRFQRTLGREVWEKIEPICSVQYYLHDVRLPHMFPHDEPGWFEKVFAEEGIEIYKNLRAWPRAYLVGGVRVEPDPERLLDLMLHPDYDPAKEVLVEAKPATPLPESGAADLGEATVTGRTSLTLTIEANAKAPAVLAAADAYYPGWNAYVNGKRAETFPAYYAFRGVVVPEGKSTVVFRYEPLSALAGLVISSLTLLVSGVCAVLLLVRAPAGATGG